MNIGFIGFGNVSKKLAGLMDENAILTSKEGRSENTVRNIDESKATVLDSFEEVARKSDILISAASPGESVKIAEKYGKLTKGIYLDLNNISPKTAIEISDKVNNFADAAIIGGINRDFTLFLAGENSKSLKFLDKYFPVKIVSNNIGDASRLKMLRSIYTKSISAVLMEVMEVAESLNLKDELMDTIAISEGENFKDSAISRIKNTKNSSKRKKEELAEILEYFPNENLEMVEAALKKLSDI